MCIYSTCFDLVQPQWARVSANPIRLVCKSHKDQGRPDRLYTLPPAEKRWFRAIHVTFASQRVRDQRSHAFVRIKDQGLAWIVHAITPVTALKTLRAGLAARSVLGEFRCAPVLMAALRREVRGISVRQSRVHQGGAA